MKGDYDDDEFDIVAKEEQKFNTKTPKPRNSKFERRGSQTHKMENESLANNKWPVRLLSLIHPFNIDITVDEALEKFFGLNLPFLDFRIGI